MNWTFEDARIVDVLFYSALVLFTTGTAVLTLFVVLPVRRVVRQLEQFALDRPELVRGLKFRNEAELLSQTFKLLTGELKTKEEELRGLYEQASVRARFMERYSERLVESIPVGVVALDAQGRVTTLNSSAERLFGVTLPDAAGKPFAETGGRGTHLTRCVEEALRSGAPLAPIEIEWRGRDGRAGPLVIQVGGGPLAGGHQPEERSFVLIVNDLTPLRRLEDQVRTAERLASIGTLSAGLAHEIRNPLNSILGYSNLLKKKLETGSDLGGLAETVEKEAQALNRVVNGFLDFVRTREMVREPVRWQELIEDVLERTARKLKERKVSVGYSGFPPSSACGLDRASAQQIVYNLLLNAVEASPEGEAVEMECTTPGGFPGSLEIRVSDRGPGIPGDLREKVFDPFFTTKPEGLGLGLSIVHRIITAAGGSIEVVERPGGGTTLRVKLPSPGGSPPDAVVAPEKGAGEASTHPV